MLKKICLVIGNPIAHSLSPLIHQTAYKALNIEEQYTYFAAQVKAESLQAAILGIRALNVKSVSVTIPHKETVLQYLDVIDPMAQKIGAVNTVVADDEGRLVGYNTDVIGVINPILRRTTLTGKKVLLLGAGGAARAAAFGFVKSGGLLTITNRTITKARSLASFLGVEVLAWEEREKAALNFDIIFNATSVGLNLKQGKNLEAPLNTFRSGQIVFDAVYNPYLTTFLSQALQAGAEIISGTEMFIEQAVQQILLYSGFEAPRDKMEQVLLEMLCKK